ncbi:hypothetical protein BDZ45DRAFT_220653 [Acephala macrosclerotiorum]|nr:hypothetical protein BDZ45DRAFT_220653 [Acephala macrosclerotiorum]
MQVTSRSFLSQFKWNLRWQLVQDFFKLEGTVHSSRNNKNKPPSSSVSFLPQTLAVQTQQLTSHLRAHARVKADISRGLWRHMEEAIRRETFSLLVELMLRWNRALQVWKSSGGKENIGRARISKKAVSGTLKCKDAHNILCKGKATKAT